MEQLGAVLGRFEEISHRRQGARSRSHLLYWPVAALEFQSSFVNIVLSTSGWQVEMTYGGQDENATQGLGQLGGAGHRRSEWIHEMRVVNSECVT